MWQVVTVVAVVVLVATYLTWVASRVDRLHARAAAAYAALDAQSIRRAAAAADLAHSYGLHDLHNAATAVRSAKQNDDRTLAENDLTVALRAAVTSRTRLTSEDVAGLVEGSRRLGIARQVHTDLVRDALVMRRRPVVRLFRFARKHPAPQFFDIDSPELDAVAARA